MNTVLPLQNFKTPGNYFIIQLLLFLVENNYPHLQEMLKLRAHTQENPRLSSREFFAFSH